MKKVFALLIGPFLFSSSALSGQIPEFRLGTVLVWHSENRGLKAQFVIRVAQFKPDRYFEWESNSTQGTVLLRESAVEHAKKYSNYRLFQAGAELESSEEMTFWLSRRTYEALKAKKKVGFYLDSIKTKLVLLGSAQRTIQVNRKPVTVQVLEAKDGRGGQWSFLDDGDNPLLVKYELRSYKQELSSVNTERTDSLRWIKGSRLKAIVTRPESLREP